MVNSAPSGAADGEDKPEPAWAAGLGAVAKALGEGDPPCASIESGKMTERIKGNTNLGFIGVNSVGENVPEYFRREDTGKNNVG